MLFLSSRNDSVQIWQIAVDGGEAALVTRLPLDVGSFAVSPDGRTLLVSLEVFPDAISLDETVRRLDEAKVRQSTGRIYDRLMIRHWDTWRDGRRSHLFALPLAGGEPVALMSGMDADAPGKPFGGAEEYTFTALQRRGIPSKFLYFPDENHWVLKPHNSIQWHDTVLDWLDQWLKP